MNIRIGDNYVITSDNMNIILNEEKTFKEGKNIGQKRLVVLGYYSTLAKCIADIPSHAVRGSEATTIGELLKDIREIKEVIEWSFGEV